MGLRFAGRVCEGIPQEVEVKIPYFTTAAGGKIATRPPPCGRWAESWFRFPAPRPAGFALGVAFALLLAAADQPASGSSVDDQIP
ncbi:MAG: hypothetical protein IPL39_14660 [Opitutaceae bacterium]|nr:hypothetical protein [Opitutaceae bacterium]